MFLYVRSRPGSVRAVWWFSPDNALGHRLPEFRKRPGTGKVIGRQCAQGDCPQLILLDINMPVMNGFGFLEAYESLDLQLKQSVVIVMLTTSLNLDDVGRIGQVPAVGYLNKPLTEAMVRHLLKQHFDPDLPG